ncbi:hypothetical protein [Stieleria varia]|nr:hypothetical protein [Stieleria varia]
MSHNESSRSNDSAGVPLELAVASDNGPFSADETGGPCCSGAKIWNSLRHYGWRVTGVAVVAASLFTATFFAGKATSLSEQLNRPQTGFNIPGLPTIGATASVTSEKFSMATGPVSQQAEGLFVLDHNSGLLQCSVMYPRQGRFLGLFTVNVMEALGSGDKGGGYIMATGLVDMPSSSQNPVASSVVYVLNTSTGAYACYGIPFDRVSMNGGRPQQAPMVLVAVGNADPILDRDDR